MDLSTVSKPRKNHIYSFGVSCFATLIGCFVSGRSPILAQTAPQIPPSNDPSRIQRELQPPQPPSPRQNITVPRPNELTPPPGAEQQRFRLESLQVSGSTVYSAPRLRQLYAKFLGREISLSDLYSIAAQITQLYRQDGYVLSQALVPEQTISNGSAKLQVIEGFVERVDFIGTPATKSVKRQWPSKLSPRAR